MEKEKKTPSKKILPKIRKMSFKWKAILWLEIFVIVINVAIGIVVWSTLHSTVRKSSKEKLLAVASAAAASIDVNKHESITSEDQRGDQDYVDIQGLLRNIKNSSDQIDDIYTMRKTDKEDVWQFVVDAEEPLDENGNGVIDAEEESAGVGEEYDISAYPQMKKAFDGPIVDENTSCDKWGCWLSGYAPMYNSEGEAVAIVGVDMSESKVIAFEKEIKAVSVIVVAVLVVLIPMLFYFILSILTRPMKKIVGSMLDFQSNMKTRLDIRTGDEFEMIAVSFNTMANDLQQIYDSLEAKVKEKTKELEDKVVEIQQRNAKDEALLASVGDGLIATDREGKIIMMNRHAVEVMGLSDVNSLLQANFCEKVILESENGEIIPEAERPIRKVLNTGTIVLMNCMYLREDGVRMPLSMTASPIIMESRIIGAIAVFRDVTKEREVDRMKSEFVSLASHQLRTPLSSIKWYAEMLILGMSGKVGAKQQKYLRQIYEANQRMVELVNSLLNVSRIEMGTFSVEPKNVDLKEIVEEIARETISSMRNKKINLEKNVDEDAARISADPTLIRIIMQNLISNAIKYTADGGNVKISIAREKKEDQVDPKKCDYVIMVSDTGMGIPIAQQSKIFGKLFRADNARDQVADGNGLGLYIVKSIVETAGGSIGFRSRENVGTTFTVKIPAEGMKQREGEKKLNLYTQVHSNELKMLK